MDCDNDGDDMMDTVIPARRSPGSSIMAPVSNGSTIQREISSFHRFFTWKQIRGVSSQHARPMPRSGAASVVVRGKLYVFGGYGGGSGRLSDFW